MRDINDPRWIKVRKFVYFRDHYTCGLCGKRNGKLECHHIIRYADSVRLRYSPNNLITLCLNCHTNLVTGNEKRYIKQFKNIVKFNIEKFNLMKRKKKVKYKMTNPRWFF